MKKWEVPKTKDREPDVLYVDSVYSEKIIDGVKAVVMKGRRFTRERICSLTTAFKGEPCNDYVCSACGKMHNAPRPSTFCPRCGARVTDVDGKVPR